MAGSIGDRKADHIALCASGDEVGFREKSTLFECVQLIHNALPELALDEIDLSAPLLGKRLRAPILIAAMTGGTGEAGEINRELASIAEERGYAFGLGSQRAMHTRPDSRDTFRVRSVAPTAPLFGNLGVVQARAMPTSQIAELLDDVGADACCIHLNPAMEIVQSGGDRDFRGGIETIARLVESLGKPVIVKETGCGISSDVANRLRQAGVEHVDVSGAGGTSWVGVEKKRAENRGEADFAALGQAFWDWGIPTAASVAVVAKYDFRTVIATGGIATGLDVAKALSLGAHLAGIARPVLQAFIQGGRRRAVQRLEQIENELRAAMLLTKKRSLTDLRNSAPLLTGDLLNWIARA